MDAGGAAVGLELGSGIISAEVEEMSGDAAVEDANTGEPTDSIIKVTVSMAAMGIDEGKGFGAANGVEVGIEITDVTTAPKPGMMGCTINELASGEFEGETGACEEIMTGDSIVELRGELLT